MTTYTISDTELATVQRLTTAVANMAGLDGMAPGQQPTQVRRLSAGWVGAEWVRCVADYQDAASVGYANMEDLEQDHEWPESVDVDWQPAPAGLR